jgi:hypothetical protein
VEATPGTAVDDLRARLHEVESLESWPDFAEAHRWTDGMPVYPPTEAAVERLIDAIGRPRTDELGEIPPRRAIATVETVAINCAMAGCKPEHVPVVLAALEAMLEPRFNLQGVQTTTHPCEPLAIISGPVVQRLGLWTGECVFGGGGTRANVAIGRAIRLLLWNVGGGFPGEPTRKIMGHPGRLAFVLPEALDSPWPAFHSDRGVDPTGSAVTMFACEAPRSISATMGTDLSPALILERVADQMCALGSNNIVTQHEQLVVIPSFIAVHLDRAGWDRPRIQEYLWDRARRPLSEVRPHSAQRPDTDPQWWWDWFPADVDQSREDSLVPSASDPSSIHVVVSGGAGGRFLALCPSWGHFGGFATTRELPTEGHYRDAASIREDAC